MPDSDSDSSDNYIEEISKKNILKSNDSNDIPKPQRVLTPEEAQLKALELQEKFRKKREEEEKRNEIEKERQRILMGHSIQQQRELLAEQERKRNIEEMRRMKEEKEREKARQMELMKKEYKEKFGIDYVEEEESLENLTDEKRKQKFASVCGQISVKYKNSKDALLQSIKILKVYLSNIINSPLEPKYKTIKKSNATFSNKVIGPVPEIADLLIFCGFKETENEFKIEGRAKNYVMSCGIKYLDVILKQVYD